MGITYICEKCGTYLPGVNAHICQIPLVESFNIHQDCLDEATLREQIAREILERLPEYTETEACKRAGFYYDRDDVIAAIARGQK